MVRKTVKKDNNTITLPATLSKTRTWLDFLNNDAFMIFPEKEDWRRRFVATMIEWAMKDDSLEIMQFAIEMKMRRQTLHEWSEKYPDFKQAYDYTKLILAMRRRTGALTRKYDKDVVFKDLHRLDPEWLEINKYHADMKTETDKREVTFIIDNGKPKVISAEKMKEEIDGTI